MYVLLDVKRSYVAEEKHKDRYQFYMTNQCNRSVARRTNGSFRITTTSWGEYAVIFFVGGAIIHLYIIQY